jgi:hypothetical protein
VVTTILKEHAASIFRIEVRLKCRTITWEGWKDHVKESKKIGQSEPRMGERRYSPMQANGNGQQEKPFSGTMQKKADSR